jgi:ATP-dependent Clp protease adaptor protein ClpS
MSEPYPPRPAGPGDTAGRSRGQLPQYTLVLHGDNANLMHVVLGLMGVARFAREEAVTKTWQAHHWGRTVLLTTWLERAEFLAEQLAGWGLHATVERA